MKRDLLKTICLIFGISVSINEGLPLADANGNFPPYLDPVGIVTICYGVVPEPTDHIKASYTKKDCDELLDKTVMEYSVVVKDLPPLVLSSYIGLLDFGYNAGIYAANNSNVKKCLMKSDYNCASKAILQWKYVSKKKITDKDRRYGKWSFNGTKYNFDCSQYVNGKPNKLCYGIWKRRLYESDLLKGTMNDKEAIIKYMELRKWE
ncbi:MULTISPECIES: lysozyme [Citrobacter]|uniref:lysozyme n=1 Tax=Citrobacter TaxID=544 RepID=UPI001900D535|nr:MULTISPECIES: hypothetical protein [Citrobacter]MBJ9134440.1 hypothetical protein [Citrobacter farmeri]MDM2738377.1 hypothetical protein [Citrobacter sp. Ct235]